MSLFGIYCIYLQWMLIHHLCVLQINVQHILKMSALSTHTCFELCLQTATNTLRKEVCKINV